MRSRQLLPHDADRQDEQACGGGGAAAVQHAAPSKQAPAMRGRRRQGTAVHAVGGVLRHSAPYATIWCATISTMPITFQGLQGKIAKALPAQAARFDGQRARQSWRLLRHARAHLHAATRVMHACSSGSQRARWGGARCVPSTSPGRHAPYLVASSGWARKVNTALGSVSVDVTYSSAAATATERGGDSMRACGGGGGAASVLHARWYVSTRATMQCSAAMPHRPGLQCSQGMPPRVPHHT